jgi:hypothetical protein
MPRTQMGETPPWEDGGAMEGPAKATPKTEATAGDLSNAPDDGNDERVD